MRITREKPRIDRYVYMQERGDPEYGSCLWAFFDIDAERGILSIHGDRGEYAHVWPEKNDSFRRLCASMDGVYMMGKMQGKKRQPDMTLVKIWETCIQPRIREDQIITFSMG